MATYFCNFSTGNDSTGTGAVGNPWKTLTKALGASGAASGDTIILFPGTFRESIVVAMTSPTVETKIIGDTTGFYTGAAPGLVIVTNYTTDDVSAPASTATLDLAGRDHLSFFNAVFLCGSSTNACIKSTTANSTDILFDTCYIQTQGNGSSANCVNLTAAADIAANWTFRRCILNKLGSNHNCCTITLPTSSVADYSAAITFDTCTFPSTGLGGIVIGASGAAAFKGGGLAANYCTFAGIAMTTATNISVTIPSTLDHCFGYTTSTAAIVSANTAGQITENNGRWSSPTGFTNVTVGGNSVVSVNSFCLLVEFGQSLLMGFLARPFLSPMAGSPLLGIASTGGTDILNRPRPAGGQLTNACGAFERGNTGRKGASLGADGGTGGYVEIVGPGYHDYEIPVTAVSTVITVKVKWDATHADTNKPQATLLANSEIGVTAETKTATGTAGSAYETLTFTAQSPTLAGVVKVRLISRSAATGGIAAFDTITGGASGSQGLDYFSMSEPMRAAVAGSGGGAAGIITAPAETGF